MSRRLVTAALALAALGAPCSSEPGAAPGGDAAVACTPAPPALDPAPPAADLTLARAVADRFAASHAPESLAWDWSEGILVAAMTDLYFATGVAAYRDYAERYLGWHAAHGYAVLASDTCAPAIAAATMVRATCDARDRDEVTTVLAFLDHDALRTDDGGISHFGVSPLLGRQLWLDSLFMFGEVLVRWSETSGDAAALDLYGAQFHIFASHLADPSGFFTHAYAAPNQEPGVFWARGNGWVLASGTDYLRVRKLRGQTDDAVAHSLVGLSRAIIAAQDPATGLFWTVVNRPGETYLETSATALFALGLARGYRIGLFDASVLAPAHRAIDGIRTKIVNDVVTGISGPTDPGPLQSYASVPVSDDLPFGVGAVVMALLETSKVP